MLIALPVGILFSVGPTSYLRVRKDHRIGLHAIRPNAFDARALEPRSHRVNEKLN
jgi:hypothetical protein